jgi:outer membrane protein assembly factor BamB
MEVSILGRHVLLTARDGIRCLDHEEGRLLWDRSGDFSAGLIAGDAGTILAGVRDSALERSRIECLAAASGELIEAIGIDGVPVATIGRLILVYWASRTRPETRLVAYNASTNEVVWESVGGGQEFVLQTSAEMVILARGQRAEARLIATGAVVWEADLGLSGAPVSSMARGVLVLGDGLAAAGLDCRTGVVLWRKDGWIWARAGTSGLYVANTRAVSSLALQTGEPLLPSFDLTESLRRPRGLVARLACAPVDYRGQAVVLTEDGWSIVFDPVTGGGVKAAVRTGARSLLGVRPHVLGNDIVFADFSLDERHPPCLYCVSLG